MLRKWIHPFLLVLVLGAGGYAYSSGQAARPVLTNSMPPVATSVAGQATPIQGAATPSPSALPKEPDVDVVVIIDNSGSMFGYTCDPETGQPDKQVEANDKDLNRVTAAQTVISALAADLKPRETKLAIISFGSTADLMQPLTQLSNDANDQTRARLNAIVQNPTCKGDTDIVASIRKAQAELRSERHNPANVPAIIFLTDGVPTLTDGREIAGEDARQQAIASVLNDLGNVKFFAVLLGKDADFKKFKQFWQQQAQQRTNLKVYSLTASEELPQIYKQITAELNNRDNAPTGQPELPVGSSVQISIPANVQQAVLTVLKPTVRTNVELKDPSGQDAAALPPGRFRSLVSNSPIDVFILQRPESGTWVVSSPDGDTLRVLQPELKSVYEIQLLQPGSQGTLSVDQATTLIAQIVDRDTGVPLSNPFHFHGSYQVSDAPPADAQPFDLSPVPQSATYTIQLDGGTFRDGVSYRFALEAQDDAGLRSDKVEYEFIAARVPAIASITAPGQVYVDDPVSVEVKLANAESAQGTVVPQFVQSLPGGARPTFTSKDSSTFGVTLPPFGRPGSYTLTVNYAGKTTTAQAFSSSRPITVVVVEHQSTIVMRALALIFALLVGIYLVFRYLLLSPLIPLLQRVGIAPQGYIRITSPDISVPEPDISLTTVLQRRRKLRRLTIGPDGDIPLMPTPEQPASQEDEVLPQKTTAHERLWGKVPLAQIARHLGGSTYIQRSNGTTSDFTNLTKQFELAGHQIDYSLRSSEQADDDPFRT